MKNKTACPVCKNTHDHVVLDHRSRVPVLQNTTLASSSEAENYPTGTVNMLRCETCSFVWNSAFDENIILYDDSYNNDVSSSQYYRDHLEQMADRILASIPENEDIHYVEIGCGDGEFMHLLMKRSEGRCHSATGFDPSFTNSEGLAHNVTVHKQFFTPDNLDLVSTKTNVICSRHTIEHIANAEMFAAALGALVKHDQIGLFLETPDANWILKNAAFQDFFYEHCSLYTPESITHLLATQGMASVVTPVYGEQYMWIEAQLGENKKASATPPDLAIHFLNKRKELLESWADYLDRRADYGPIAIWGAASKGVTFSLLLHDNGATGIDYAIDLNEQKQNRFLPITSLPVIDVDTAITRGVSTVIIMNPNYENEIKAMAEAAGWSPEFATLNG